MGMVVDVLDAKSDRGLAVVLVAWVPIGLLRIVFDVTDLRGAAALI